MDMDESVYSSVSRRSEIGSIVGSSSFDKPSSEKGSSQKTDADKLEGANRVIQGELKKS